MTDTGRNQKLLDEERSRLLELKESLMQATEDVEREPTGDPSAGGHLADAGSEMFERSRDLSIVQDLDAQLADIEHAKARLANGSYGTLRSLRQADRRGAIGRSTGNPVLHRGPAGSRTRGPDRVNV